MFVSDVIAPQLRKLYNYDYVDMYCISQTKEMNSARVASEMVHVKTCTWYTLSEISFSAIFMWANHLSTQTIETLPLLMMFRSLFFPHHVWLYLAALSSSFTHIICKWIYQSFHHYVNLNLNEEFYLFFSSWISSMSKHNCIKSNV